MVLLDKDPQQRVFIHCRQPPMIAESRILNLKLVGPICKELVGFDCAVAVLQNPNSLLDTGYKQK